MLPHPIEPMLPQRAARLPADSEGWAYEVKYDGFRAIVSCDAVVVRVQSRNQRDMTPHYPELQELRSALRGRRVVLDGEIVAFDEAGRQDFERMQARAGFVGDQRLRRRATAPAPISFQVFDVLLLDDKRTTSLPYEERRRILEDLELRGPHWLTPQNHVGAGADAILAATREAGLEGLVAKRLGSRYVPGARTPNWLKIKNWQRQEFVVGGWRQDAEGAGGWLGALLLGVHDQAGQLRYAGGVEMGFGPESLDALAEVLPGLAVSACPFGGKEPERRDRHVAPSIVVEVQFIGWTSNGCVRQASFKGFVLDKAASGVRRER